MNSHIKKEVENDVDHCNNESSPGSVKKSPVRTYGKRSAAQKESTVSSSQPKIEGDEAILKNDDSVKTPTSPEYKLAIPGAVTVSVTEPVKIKIPVRKRKIIIDAQKQIKNSDFKRQLVETEDILQKPNMNIAPTTKRAMKCLESGGVAQFFSSPGRVIQNWPLSRLYCNKLVMELESGSEQKTPKTATLDPSSLQVLQEDGGSTNADSEGGKSPGSQKQSVHIGKLPVQSLENLFRSLDKPVQYKEYACSRLSQRSDPSSTPSYLKRKNSSQTENPEQLISATITSIISHPNCEDGSNDIVIKEENGETENPGQDSITLIDTNSLQGSGGEHGGSEIVVLAGLDPSLISVLGGVKMEIKVEDEVKHEGPVVEEFILPSVNSKNCDDLSTAVVQETSGV